VWWNRNVKSMFQDAREEMGGANNITNLQRESYQGIEDYELQASIRLRSPTRVLRRKGGAMLLPYMDVTPNQTEWKPRPFYSWPFLKLHTSKRKTQNIL
jgi:hypothetical protein